MAAVSADDLNQTDDIILENDGENAFSQLQKMIDDADENATINLENDYVSDGEIIINKTITVEGNGYTLDGDHSSRIFNISASGVVLKNINFKNGVEKFTGGAIYTSEPSSLTCIGCSFFNNYAYGMEDIDVGYSPAFGGAIYALGNLNIKNTTFTDNEVSLSGGEGCMGGAIYCRGEITDISGSVFENNVANMGYGGAIDAGGKLTLTNCDFINNSADFEGGAIEAGNAIINRCTFTQNTASWLYGGAISLYGGNVRNSNFTNNKANSGDAIYSYSSFDLSDSTFIRKADDMIEKIYSDVSKSTLKDKDVVVCEEDYNILGCTLIEMGPDVHSFNLTLQDVEKYYGDSESLEITLTDYDSPVSNATIVVEINGKNESIYTNGEGKAYYDLDLDAGVYDAVAYYDDINATAKVTVNPVSTNTTLFYAVNGKNVIFTVFVSSPNASGEVVFTVNGKNYTASLIDSKIDYNLSDLDEGSYVANVTYTGDVNHESSMSNNVSFDIVDYYVFIIAPDLKMYYHGPKRFVAILLDYEQNPVKNASVSITINGNTYTRITDDKGVVAVSLNLNSGVYPVTTRYDIYEASSTVTIKPTVSGENVTKMFRNGTQYYARFVDSEGWTLAENTAVEFNINGVFYTRYTDKNGIARMNINLNPGVYEITAKNPASGEQYTNIITVLPSIVENHDLVKYYRNASQYSVKILDGKGSPVGANVSVKFNINGVFYTRFTNESGYARLNINLNPGDYVITAEYNDLRASNNITVLSTIETRDLFMKYKDGSQFNATILNGQGEALAGEKVTFNINGVFYERISDEKGIAHLNINLMDGEYVITTTHGTLSVSNTIVISSGPADFFITLQRKIDAAREGDTIYLEYDVIRGIFYEDAVQITVDDIYIDKAITIDGKGHTIDACSYGRTFIITSDNVTLKNITFINGYVNDYGAAICNAGDNLLISNCNFRNNVLHFFDSVVDEGRGGAICTYANMTVTDSVFSDNEVLVIGNGSCKGGAIYSSAALTVQSSEFRDNTAEEGSAIWAYALKTDISDDCTFINNENVLVNGGNIL